VENVAIITGGAGGMGLAAAKLVGSSNQLVICDLNQEKLDKAKAQLTSLGIRCETFVCDIANSESVSALFKHSNELGPIKSVIHTAGISPQMANPKTIMRVNGIGTINITNESLKYASEGFALVNVASMAAYLFPTLLAPTRAYKRAFDNTDAFLKKATFPSYFMPTQLYRSGLAYAISKHFVIWYSKKCASVFGEKGARIVSVSPGSFDTEMGRLEEKSGSAEMLKNAALKRFGNPNEIAEILAFCASEKASYLTGVDILCDGGVVAAKV